VLVVGGGVAGLAAAAWCRMQGLGEVVVVERAQLGSGPSGRAAGALIPDVHALAYPDAFTALARRGLELHEVLHARWGASSSLRHVPCRVVPPKVPTEVALPRQAVVDPIALLTSLAAEAGAVATGVTVTGWEAARGRVTAVQTTAGEVRPGAVVVATGRGPDLAGGRDLAAIVGAVKGHLIATAPLPTPVDAIIVSDIVVVPLAGGRLIAGGTFDVEDPEPDVRPDVVGAIRAALVRLVPAAAAAELTHAWTCFRPAAADGLPVVDRVPGVDNAWFVAGLHHTGLLTAPAVGEALATWIASGDRPPLVDALGLDRLGLGRPTPRAT